MITMFDTADDVVCFIKDVFGEDLDAIRAVRDIDRGHNYQWVFFTGKCDICKAKMLNIIPACGEIYGSECSACGNMSVYPDEDDDKEDSNSNYDLDRYDDEEHYETS